MLIGDIYRKLYGLLFSKPTNFKWLVENKVAGSGFINSKTESESSSQKAQYFHKKHKKSK